MPDKGKKKKGMTRAEWERKQAEKAYAGPGTKLAPKGSKMRTQQEAEAKKRSQSGDKVKYSSVNRERNIDEVQARQQREREAEAAKERSTFKNSDQDNFKKKGYFGK